MKEKLLVARIVKAADQGLSHRELPAIVVVGNPEWRPAVLGLVANKLQEKYNRSFFVWGQGGDGSIKGSCRMIAIHHAAQLFQALPEGALLHAGGHQAAGGFSVSKEQVHFLEESLNNAVAEVGYVQDEVLETKTISLPLGAVTTRHLQVVRSLAPFGVANPEPLFLFENVLVESTKMFGKSKEHIECSIKDYTGGAVAFSFFATDELLRKIDAGNTISFIGSLEAGYRGGVRIHIKRVI